ncbi:hypothetical protein HCJ66_11345 [Listeria sp. FSL L7-1582]|uniref:hypothetical protein n=1 Tax=Listeria portnoyi TaxID=2713504 RepID=UPI00164E68DD|nr:hypothetical protein [Listeria portnoyi]MBC6310132.1 hypothetical protein [Listeria portnoyi]
MDVTPMDSFAAAIKQLCAEAAAKGYEQGIEDAREKYKLPPVLENEDLSRIFKLDKSSVSAKLIKLPGFPKLKYYRGKYPTSAVLNWMDENTEYVDKIREGGKR